MNLNRIDYAYNFFDSKRGENDVYIILHALLHCLTEHDIQNAYLTYGQQDGSFKSTLESFVTKRVAENPGVAYINVAESLISQIETENDFKKRRPYLTFLSKIIGNMPGKLVERYFFNLIRTSRLSDHNYAYQVAPLIWSGEIKNLLIKSFETYASDKCLLILIQNLTPEELLPLVNEEVIWEEGYFYRRVKRSIISKLAALDIQELDFVRLYDIDSYIYLLSLKRHQLAGNDFKHHIDAIPVDKKKDKVWFLGLLGDWDSIVTLH